MLGKAAKYADETAVENHGGTLHWPGTPEGFPVRSTGGSMALLRADEAQERIVHVIDFHSRLFRLFDPGDKALFDKVMDRIVNGWYIQLRRVDRWSDDPGGLIVWLEWGQVYGQITNE